MMWVHTLQHGSIKFWACEETYGQNPNVWRNEARDLDKNTCLMSFGPFAMSVWRFPLEYTSFSPLDL